MYWEGDGGSVASMPGKAEEKRDILSSIAHFGKEIGVGNFVKAR